ncbi:MAG: hypothetical protein MI867_07645 [Pseudomonadales bacterium]|nr:hypothetical protein [Pseudomonadales bacterium]
MASMKGFILTLLFTVPVLLIGCNGGSSSSSDEDQQGNGGSGEGQEVGNGASTNEIPQGGGSNSGNDNNEYTDITAAEGFSSSYLQDKTFFEQSFDSETATDYLTSLSFANGITSTTVTVYDEFNNIQVTTAYSIVTSNGIIGVLSFGQGIRFHYNILQVEEDHLKLCVTSAGIDTVITCTVDQAVDWYFDRDTAIANFP